MALVSCPECGKDVSTHAEACPNCGCPKDLILTSIKTITETRKSTDSRSTDSKSSDERTGLDMLMELEEELEEKIKGSIKKVKNMQKNLEDLREMERLQFRRLSYYYFSRGLIDCFFLCPDFIADQRLYMEVCLRIICLFIIAVRGIRKWV